jgi:hypothetical protein
MGDRSSDRLINVGRGRLHAPALCLPSPLGLATERDDSAAGRVSADSASSEKERRFVDRELRVLTVLFAGRSTGGGGVGVGGVGGSGGGGGGFLDVPMPRSRTSSENWFQSCSNPPP